MERFLGAILGDLFLSDFFLGLADPLLAIEALLGLDRLLALEALLGLEALLLIERLLRAPPTATPP
jgi:hypothetical protein